MADVRALLKAKRTERGTVTKSTRASAARVPKEGAGRTDGDDRRKKRKFADDTAQGASIPGVSPGAESLIESDKRRRLDNDSNDNQTQSGQETGFPADFFSDPPRAPAPAFPSSDEDDNDERAALSPSQPRPSPKSIIDAEFEAFQRTISSVTQRALRPPDQEAFARATVTAEPELLTDIPSGFPSSVLDRERPDAAEENLGPTSHNGGAEADAADVQESEGDKFKRKEREERELIMDRLLDEERAQEEADAKVASLKARLELLKKKRVEARAAKLSQSSRGPVV
jgi:zinc finger protein 830